MAMLNGLGQDAASRQACAQYPFAERSDETAFLGQRNEGAGRNHAAAWVVPAHQRFEASDLTADKRLRLIIQFQLVACDSRTEVVLESSLLAQPFVHVGLEEADRPAFFRFRVIQCGVGIGDEALCVRAVVRINAHPDRQASVQQMTIDRNILCKRHTYAFGNRFRRGRLWSDRGDHRELIAS